MDAKRLHQRFSVSLPIEYRSVAGGSFCEGKALNLSRGGLYFRLVHPPALGTLFEVKLMCQEKPPVRCTGKLIRIDTLPPRSDYGISGLSGCAIQWIDLMDDDWETLQALIVKKGARLMAHSEG